jgi:hypothetical protein
MTIINIANFADKGPREGGGAPGEWQHITLITNITTTHISITNVTDFNKTNSTHIVTKLKALGKLSVIVINTNIIITYITITDIKHCIVDAREGGRGIRGAPGESPHSCFRTTTQGTFMHSTFVCCLYIIGSVFYPLCICLLGRVNTVAFVPQHRVRFDTVLTLF